jgi:protoheme IX farnesyltransferase
VPLADARRTSSAADYLELTKPRLNFLVVLTSAGGFYLANPGVPSFVAMAFASIGTALVAGGAAALNQVAERDTDALMVRTRLRPLPAQRVTPEEARIFGIALAGAGIALLGATANLLAASLALATLIIYLAIYTPLKRRSPLSTLVGAIPGALPPLIGWTAARGAPSAGGWALFAIVFVWQVPHFMAIAWMYRDDYRKARFPMLPVIEPEGRRAGRQAVLYAAALVPVSLAPAFTGVAGQLYFVVALVLGTLLLALAARFASTRSDASARQLFFGSITYLPLVWAAMMLDH